MQNSEMEKLRESLDCVKILEGNIDEELLRISRDLDDMILEYIKKQIEKEE